MPHRTFILLSVVWTLISSYALGDEGFQYFQNSDLNFWSSTPNPDNKVSTLPVISPLKPHTAFPWKNYLDPKNDEFFKEGDYTPPAPFMEIARNPNDENIANWFKYLETKNLLTQRLQERLEAYVAKHPTQGVGVKTQAVSIPPAPKMVALDADAKRFRLRLYFDSNCPHCQRMLGTMTELSHLGYWIELKQIDADTSVRAHISMPVSSADPKELKQYQITGVPLLLVGDLKRGTFFKIQGYQSTDAVLQALRSEPTIKPGGHS